MNPRIVLARVGLVAGLCLAVYGCVDLCLHPHHGEGASWLTFLGFLVVLMCACWLCRLRDERR